MKPYNYPHKIFPDFCLPKPIFHSLLLDNLEFSDLAPDGSWYHRAPMIAFGIVAALERMAFEEVMNDSQ